MRSYFEVSDATVDFLSVSYLIWNEVGPLPVNTEHPERRRRRELSVYFRGDTVPVTFPEKEGEELHEAWLAYLRYRDNLIDLATAVLDRFFRS